MKYTKPFLTFEQQADQLLARGLRGDRATLMDHLKSVSYFRLSGYWIPFRMPDPADRRKKLDEFFPSATIEKVWDTSSIGACACSSWTPSNGWRSISGLS